MTYISPEALRYQGHKIKLGTASDIWSLGIILYEMYYKTTPFAQIKAIKSKVHAITSEEFIIQYPPAENSEIVNVMKLCLQRDPKKRPTTTELLAHPFLQ